MKVIQVSSLKKVDTTRYIEGTLFLGDKQIAVLHNGKLDPLMKQSDLKGFMKRKDVEKMIATAIKKEVTE